MDIEDVRRIEQKFQVESVRAQSHQVWALIRYSLWTALLYDINPIKTQKLNVTKIIRLSVSFFFGFRNYFRRYDYLALSDSSERKYIDGKFIDKSIDPILEFLPKTLLIEIPLPSHFAKSKVPTKFLASKLPIYAFEWIYAKWAFRNVKIENEIVLKTMLSEAGVAYQYHDVLKRGLAQYKAGCLLCKLYKPKALLVQCAYTNTGLVKAFRDFNIPVVEVQHGMISASHIAYNLFKKLDESYFPDYFLSFGNREKDFFEVTSKHYIKPDRIFAIGHYYLDRISMSHRNEKYLKVAPGQKLVVITGQNLPQLESRFIHFIESLAREAGHIFFAYVPRSRQSEIYSFDGLPANLKIIDHLDTYRLINEADVHTTMFSTCAIEAVALGTPNILVNLDSQATTHFEGILNKRTTFIVNSEQEYLIAFEQMRGLKKEDVKKLNHDLIEVNYQSRIREFVDGYLNQRTQ